MKQPPSHQNEPSSSNEKSLDELLNLYIKNMSIQEQKAYKIAKSNLESSYDMENSIGFINFLKNNNYIIRL